MVTTPELIIGASGAVLCVVQKLAAVKMAIRAESDSQKAVAIDAGIDQGQLSRKLSHQESFTFDDLDRLPLDVQRAALLEMLTQMGLPERVNRWLSIARVVDTRRKQSA
jgi:hypothetical protein